MCMGDSKIPVCSFRDNNATSPDCSKENELDCENNGKINITTVLFRSRQRQCDNNDKKCEQCCEEFSSSTRLYAKRFKTRVIDKCNKKKTCNISKIEGFTDSQKYNVYYGCVRKYYI